MKPHKLLLTSLFTAMALSASAQGTAFTYQGQLNSNGSPASGTYNLTFSLFNTNTNGVAVAGPVTNNAVGVTNGLFSVVIDFGPGTFTGATNWLEIAVETNGVNTFTTLAPRQQLTPAPYAIYAESASGLSGTLSASQLTSLGNSNSVFGGNFFVGPSGNSTTSGYDNTAIGAYALIFNTSGWFNTANGFAALSANMSGVDNTANGTAALASNTSGGDNTANGTAALLSNTNGGQNTANGSWALAYNTSGSDNIAVGYQAGANFTGSESSNIDIGNPGVAGENNIIRIGSGQSQTFIAGVISGNGGGLTNLNAGNLTGVIPAAQMPAVVLTNNETGVTLTGTFSGNGAELTNLNGANLLAGSVDTAQLASGSLAAPASVGGTTLNATANTSYVVTNTGATSIWLPANANLGDVVQITGEGAGGWTAMTQIWTEQTSAPTYAEWYSVASSSDGSHLAAVVDYGGIYTSANFGVTWTEQTGAPTSAGWESVASSSDGSHLAALAGPGGLYTSTNFGVTWTEQTGAPTSAGWESVASSSDGSHLAVVVLEGGIYTSANFGVTWTEQTSAPTSTNWFSVASSSDGSHLAAVVFEGGIYTSTNFGVTWTEQTSAPTSTNWQAVASSSDGSHLAAVVFYGGGIYTSANFGVTWTEQTSAPTSAWWEAVASSSDGSHLAAVVWGGGIYASTNFGVTWTEQTSAPTGATWASVASSSDGSHLAAVEYYGGIYTTPTIISSGVAGTSASFQYLGNGQWGTVSLAQSSLPTIPPGMALIPAGVFTMGDSLDGESDATPIINITVSAFYMDVNLVSYAQWQSVFFWATNHGYGFVNVGAGKAANHPVQTVDWYDCVKWSNARSQQAGLTPVYYTDAGFTQVYMNGEVTPYMNMSANGYRLPTEAEWEKAARGGLTGQRFPWGNIITENLANYDGYTAISYDLGPNGNNTAFTNGVTPYTSPVGYFAPNGYGLYDMAGNVFEWCWDWYGPYGQPTNTNPTGPATGSNRVLRGGDWDSFAYSARCAHRLNGLPDYADDGLGFRCVRGH